jgi:Icc-related predicted phosphoesterase
MKIAALGDIHVRENDHGKWHELFTTLSSEADVILICGDLTDTGTIAEAETLAQELKACTKPVFAVLGNHDYEHNLHEEVKKILTSDNVTILDGEAAVVGNIGIAGIKGFGGGFGHFMLPRWGENMNKEYVNETVKEALLLDSALARLDGEYRDLKKIVIMHYSPIKETVEGEPLEIMAFLGCSRLVEPINGREVSAVFHGHAHAGKLHGKTNTGVDVYNVSIPVLKKEGLDKPYFILEV